MEKGFKLSFSRQSQLSTAQIWQGWTDPETIVKWFTPAPWKTLSAYIELIPGGAFRSEMAGPEGEKMVNEGCILLVENQRRLVWTNALAKGFIPQVLDGEGAFPFTGEILLTPIDGGTLYQASVFHDTAANRDIHAAMGFEVGWNAAFDQLEALFGTK